MPELLLDAAGRRRSPATLPEFHAGRPPRNKGMRYPADPPTIEEIVTVMRRAGDSVHGRRLRGLIVVLWRAGPRICEALALAEADLDARRGSLLVRRETSCLTLVWAVLDLYITHAKNGIRFSEFERQRMRRIRHAGSQPTTDEEVSAA